MRGYGPGRFSFNVKGGRCEACAGDGTIKIEMNFLPDVYVPCEVCKGARYNRETLEVHYKGKNVAEVLDMPIEEAAEFFKPIGAIHRHLATLTEVGLGYVRLGQPAPDALRRRGPARQAGLRAAEALDGPDDLHPRRADHRPALRGHPQAARRHQRPRRQGQHRPRHRAQPRRHQGQRLGGRHGPRGRQQRRHRRRPGHPGAGRGRGGQLHRSVPGRPRRRPRSRRCVAPARARPARSDRRDRRGSRRPPRRAPWPGQSGPGPPAGRRSPWATRRPPRTTTPGGARGRRHRRARARGR